MSYHADTRYSHTCPMGHRWNPGGALGLSAHVCASCGWTLDETPGWLPCDVERHAATRVLVAHVVDGKRCAKCTHCGRNMPARYLDDGDDCTVCTTPPSFLHTHVGRDARISSSAVRSLDELWTELLRPSKSNRKGRK